MLQVENLLDVVSLYLKEGLIAFILNFEECVFMLLHLLLKVNVIIGGIHQTGSEILGKDDFDDTDLLDDNSVGRKLLLKILLNLCGHFRLDVSDSIDLVISNKVSDGLV